MLLTVTSYKQGPDGHAILPTATIAVAYLHAHVNVQVAVHELLNSYAAVSDIVT